MHYGAIKKFGYQTIGKKSGSNEKIAKIMCMHKNYDFVLAPSEATAYSYREAFDISNEQIKYLGMPRIDFILKESTKKKEMFKKYNIKSDKKVILYAPTFRKFEKISLNDITQKIDTSKYYFVIKLHPLDEAEINYNEKEGIILDKEFSAEDWLKISNKFITDYSSLAIEAALLDKEIYFYTYDLEKYKSDPGINIDFNTDSIGKYQTSDINILIDLIEEDYDYDALRFFKEKYISVNTNECTKQIVEFISELVN